MAWRRACHSLALLSLPLLGSLAPLTAHAAVDPGLPALEQLRRLGVELVEQQACGGPGQLATYNMGLNQLCLSTALRAQPQLRDRVLHHELVHVVQDCLDGLDPPTSLTLHEGLRGTGAFSERQLDGFFLQYLHAQGNLRHVVATTAMLPQDSRQREVEAYALQSDPPLVLRLLQTRCRPLLP